MRKFSAEVHKSFQVRIIMHMQFNTSSILLRLNMLRYYSMHKCDSKYVSTKFDHAWALKAKCKCNTNFEPTQSILINCRRHFDGLRRNRQFQPSRPECLSLKGKVWQKWIEVQNVTRINCDQNKSSVAGRLVFEGNTIQIWCQMVLVLRRMGKENDFDAIWSQAGLPTIFRYTKPKWIGTERNLSISPNPDGRLNRKPNGRIIDERAK